MSDHDLLLTWLRNSLPSDSVQPGASHSMAVRRLGGSSGEPLAARAAPELSTSAQLKTHMAAPQSATAAALARVLTGSQLAGLFSESSFVFPL